VRGWRRIIDTIAAGSMENEPVAAMGATKMERGKLMPFSN